jgi:hypothetical protein
MKSTVSLHKVWIARTAGLFVLTALAIAYFAFPTLTMGIQVQNLNLQKLKNAANVKVAFVGAVNTAAPASLTANTGFLNIVRFSKVPLKLLTKGEWIALKVTDTDPKSASLNQSFPWTCTIFNIDQTSGQTQCILGQPGNFKLTSANLMTRLQGTLVQLKLTPDAQGNVNVAPVDAAGSGWGQTATIL